MARMFAIGHANALGIPLSDEIHSIYFMKGNPWTSGLTTTGDPVNYVSQVNSVGASTLFQHSHPRIRKHGHIINAIPGLVVGRILFIAISADPSDTLSLSQHRVLVVTQSSTRRYYVGNARWASSSVRIPEATLTIAGYAGGSLSTAATTLNGMMHNIRSHDVLQTIAESRRGGNEALPANSPAMAFMRAAPLVANALLPSIDQTALLTLVSGKNMRRININGIE